MFPLALLGAGVLMAVSAHWGSWFLTPERGASRLLHVLAVVEAAAFAAGVVLYLSVRLGWWSCPVGLAAAESSAALAAITNITVWRFRQEERVLKREVVRTLVVLAAAAVVFVAVILVASLLGLTGA